MSYSYPRTYGGAHTHSLPGLYGSSSRSPYSGSASPYSGSASPYSASPYSSSSSLNASSGSSYHGPSSSYQPYHSGTYGSSHTGASYGGSSYGGSSYLPSSYSSYGHDYGSSYEPPASPGLHRSATYPRHYDSYQSGLGSGLSSRSGSQSSLASIGSLSTVSV